MAGAYAYRTMDLSSDSGYTSRFVFSAWVKRSKLSYANAPLFSLHKNNSNTASKINFNFNASDQLSFTMQDSGGSEDSEYQTNRKFRDTNSWYHIYLAFNSTLSTSADRLQIYVNGVRETSFSSANEVGSTFGALMTSAMDFRIGTMKNNSGTAYYFDGLMNSAIFTNYQSGTVDPVTDFGEVDSTTGEWKIKLTPAVTYATQGVFVLKNGNSLTDQSGQSNNMTVGGTLTATKDCPDNIMATLNPLSGSTSNNTLSNGNNTIAVTSGWRWRPSTIAPSSGKYYAEFKPTSSGNIYTAIGVTPQVSWKDIDGETIGSGAGGENKSVAYTHSGTVIKGNSTQYSGSSYAPNDIIGVALDLDNHKVYFSKNGTYQNSGNPASGATGTGAVSLDATLDDWSISISCAGTTVSANYGNGFFGTTAITTNSGNGYAGAEGASKFSYQPPSGYSALNTKGLNT